LESDDDVFNFDSDDDEDDDMPIMSRHRKRRKIMVGDSIVNGAGKKKKNKKKAGKKTGKKAPTKPVTLIHITTLEMKEYTKIVEAAKAVTKMLGDESDSIQAISNNRNKIYRLLDLGGGIWHWNLDLVPYYLHPTNEVFDYNRICQKIWYGEKAGTPSPTRPVTLIHITTLEMKEYNTIAKAAKAVIEMLGDEFLLADSSQAIHNKIYRMLDLGGGIWHWNLDLVPYYLHPTNEPLDYPRICQKIWYGEKTGKMAGWRPPRPITLIHITTLEMKEYTTIAEAAKAVTKMLGDEFLLADSSQAIHNKIGRMLDLGGGIWHWDLEKVPYYLHPTNEPLDYPRICEKIWYGDGSLLYTQCSECTGRAQYPLGLWKGLCVVCFRNKYDVQPIQLQMAKKFADLDFTSMFQKIVINRMPSESLPDFHRVIPASNRLLWLEDDGNGHSKSEYSNDLSRFTTDANKYISMGYSVGLIRYDHKNYPELDEYHEKVIREVWHELLDDDFTGFRIVYINFDNTSRRYLEAVGKYGTLVKRVVIDKSDNTWEYVDDTDVLLSLGQLAV